MIQKTKLISLTIAQELLQKVDRAAREDYCSRSDFVRQALIDALKRRDKTIRTAQKSTLSAMSDKELEELYALFAKEKHHRAVGKQLASQERHFRRPSAL